MDKPIVVNLPNSVKHPEVDFVRRDDLIENKELLRYSREILGSFNQMALETSKNIKPYEKERENFAIKANPEEYEEDLKEFIKKDTAAIRIVDGTFVVDDCVGGVRVQTETNSCQVLEERIRPALTVNKRDLRYFELQFDGEGSYQTFPRIIENANLIGATYEDSLLGDDPVYHGKGTTASFVRLHSWAFTPTHFARMYTLKFGVDKAEMGDKLGPTLHRLGTTMKLDEKDVIGKAQKHCVENLFEGPFDGIHTNVSSNGNHEGSLIVYVSKMISAFERPGS
ncbi:elongation factor 2-like [Durio zibethinus]|uniref:Elongation factor 2-like n=1 Tax=Durio zibethinus TaxID=66656 RepID=A0A6P5ZRG8_DURZI|nr:elongation factor 2-like [Durio zibethinus]